MIGQNQVSTLSSVDFGSTTHQAQLKKGCPMLGDGIRRSLAKVTKEERDLLRDAILQLNQVFYSPAGSRADFPAGHVSQWFKQDEIHQSSHVHGCPAFLPWHRDLLNRFEALLRTIDPRLSLHYWDWTLDPSNMPDGEGGTINLFDSDFMGNADGTVNGGAVGQPLLGAGFYDPAAANFRDDNSPVRLVRPNPADPSTFSYPDPTTPPLFVHYNPADPPQSLTRSKQAGAPPVGGPGWATDDQFATATSWEKFRDMMYGDEQGTVPFPEGAHGNAHSYIGGNLSDPHLSFRDPFVFFLHSNIDRLWAMWQRQPGHLERLDPAQVYNTEETTTTIAGRNDVEVGEPFWGIQLPLAPWAGFAAQAAVTPLAMKDVWPVRPWAAAPTGQPPEDEENLPGNNQISTDPTLVIPPSYDTAVHTSYVIVNRDTFSTSEINTGKLTYPNAFYVVYDGFIPKEMLATPPAVPTNLPTFAFMGASKITAALSKVNPVSYENSGGAVDMPQRIMLSFDITFADGSDFPPTSGGEKFVSMQANLTYNVDTGTGGTVVPQTAIATSQLVLVNQPNPYMIDVDPAAQNPYWLSIDTRVFQVKGPGPGGSPAAGSVLGVTQGDMDADSNAPFTFINQVLSALQGSPAQFDNVAIFPTDETASELELSQKVGPAGSKQRVYNYVVARVRYLAPSGVFASSDGTGTGTGVSTFFRVFTTAVSGLDYDATSGTRGNYRRTGNTNGSAVPLLGIENDTQGHPETASIPFFAMPRIRASSSDSGAGPIQSMTAQPADTTNIQTIPGTGSENVAFFGAWLDINLAPGDPNYHEFPLNADPVSPDGGPFTVATQSVQQLMLNTHHCLVAEIFFWPSGTSGDPIPHEASPASSDRLAQRNLVLVRSGNPGFPATHQVQTTFIVKPSQIAFDQPGAVPTQVSLDAPAVAGVTTRFRGPDELIIRWNNVPRNSEATIYMPEIGADEILALSALRQHPTVLEKVDAHTLRCRLADVTFVPLPMNRKGTIAGLMSLTLPQGIKTEQVFKFSVEQYSGSTLKTLGAFQMTIPVRPDEELLPEESRKLSLMRYIQQGIPEDSRWASIFARYTDQIAARVQGFGGDPDDIEPSFGGDPEEADGICIQIRVLNRLHQPRGGTVDIEFEPQDAGETVKIKAADATKEIDVLGLQRYPQIQLYKVTVTPTDVFKPTSKFLKIPPSGFDTVEFVID